MSRVSSLLARIAAEEGDLRTLASTRRFLAGVGWSVPRSPAAPPAVDRWGHACGPLDSCGMLWQWCERCGGQGGTLHGH
jgi:hypothetical protein